MSLLHVIKKLPTKNLEEATFSDKTIMQTLHERQRRAVSVNGRHEGVTVKYVCAYQDTTQSCLKTHKLSVHVHCMSDYSLKLKSRLEVSVRRSILRALIASL